MKIKKLISVFISILNKIFLFSQNYIALKFSIKKFFGFKEVGSIFSLGYFRYKRIKEFLKFK